MERFERTETRSNHDWSAAYENIAASCWSGDMTPRTNMRANANSAAILGDFNLFDDNAEGQKGYMKVYRRGAGKMTDETDKAKEIASAQEAPETILRGGVIKNLALQGDWRDTQKHHMLGQDESATDLFHPAGGAGEKKEKFELFDSANEQTLLASNLLPASAPLETIPKIQPASAEQDAIIARDLKQDYQGLRNAGIGRDIVRVTSPGSDRLVFPYRGTEDARLAECTKANPQAWNDAFQTFPELGKYLSEQDGIKLMKALVRNELHNYDVKDRMGDNKSIQGNVPSDETLGYSQISVAGVKMFAEKYPRFRDFLANKGFVGKDPEAHALQDPSCTPMIVAAKLQAEIDTLRISRDKLHPDKQIQINWRTLAYTYNADVYYNPKSSTDLDIHANIIPKAKELEHLRGYEKAYPTSDERVLSKSQHLKNVENQLAFLR